MAAGRLISSVATAGIAQPKGMGGAPSLDAQPTQSSCLHGCKQKKRISVRKMQQNPKRFGLIATKCSKMVFEIQTKKSHRVTGLCIFTVRHGCKLLVGSKRSSLPRRHDLCSAEPLARTCGVHRPTVEPKSRCYHVDSFIKCSPLNNLEKRRKKEKI